jgi:hypothetical protein
LRDGGSIVLFRWRCTYAGIGGLAHSPSNRVPHLGASFRLHTLFQRCHDVDDFTRCLALSRNLVPATIRFKTMTILSNT